jgi:hypothetical protein
VREVFGKVVLLTHHTRIFYLSFVFSPNIGVLGFLACLFRRILLFLIVIIFLLPSRLLRFLGGGLHRVHLGGLSRGHGVELVVGAEEVGLLAMVN